MSTLEIKNLHVSVADKEILKGIDLTIKENEIHALLGPNGNGKSTLLSTIMGQPKYIVTKGEILLDGKDVLRMSVDERAKAGLFLALQYPPEIPGVINSDFLKAAINAKSEKPVSLYKFISELENATKEVNLPLDMIHRNLNDGFSGGEKKRNEILQMKMLKPKFAILDEIDSGLDVDALKIVGENVNMMKSPDFGALIITHYERLLDYLGVDKVHVLINGKIVADGGLELIEKIDQQGYDWIKEELGIEDETRVNPSILGSCAVKKVTGDNNE